MLGRKLATALVGTALAATLAITGSTPATAAASYYTIPSGTITCNTGYACAWYETDWAGGGVGFYSDAWDWSAIGSYNWINNNSMSWDDHGTSGYGNVRFFANAGGSGTNRCLKMGYTDSDESAIANVISANVWVSSCTGYTQFSGQYKVY